MPAHSRIPPEQPAKQPDLEYVVGGSLHPWVVDIAQLLQGCVSATPI